MYSLAHICYICLANSANSETTNILKEDTNGIFVSDKIQCLLPEFINFLPQISKLICSKCLINIDNIYRFRQKCLQNLNILKKYLQNENKYQNNDVITTELQPIKSSKINERCEEDNSDIIEIKFENFLENRVDGFLENIEIEEKILDDLKGVKRENLDGEEKHFVDDAEVTTETNETQIESNSNFPPNLNEPGNETIQSRNEAEILHSSYAEVYIKEENIDDYMPENLCQEDIANHDVTDPINKSGTMPRKSIRKTTRQNWDANAMINALDAVKEGMPYKTASKRFSVPVMALKRRAKGKNVYAVGGIKVLGSGKKIFNEQQEQELIQYITENEETMYGLTTEDVLKFAYNIAERNNLNHPFSAAARKAGKEWLRRFLQRHPEITLRAPEATSAPRARTFNNSIVE